MVKSELRFDRVGTGVLNGCNNKNNYRWRRKRREEISSPFRGEGRGYSDPQVSTRLHQRQGHVTSNVLTTRVFPDPRTSIT